MSAHEYAVQQEEVDRQSTYQACIDGGWQIDSQRSLWRSRAVYQDAYNLYCQAVVWASVRRIVLDGDALVAAYQADGLIRLS